MIIENTTIDEKDYLNFVLAKMYLLENESVLNPAFRNFCFENFSQFQSNLELYQNLHSFVFYNFTYKEDLDNQEILISPKHNIFIKSGDCDDFALFIKSVLRVFNIPAFYILLGKNENEYSHIAVITHDNFLIDGTNDQFNQIPNKYKFFKVIK